MFWGHFLENTTSLQIDLISFTPLFWTSESWLDWAMQAPDLHISSVWCQNISVHKNTT